MGFLTTNHCRNVRLKGGPSPTSHNASVFCLICCCWCKALFTALIWNSLLFCSYPQMTLWVFCAIHLTCILNQAFRSKMWTSYMWHHKTDFCSLFSVMISLMMTAFASEKISVSHFFILRSCMGHILINLFHKCWNCTTWLRLWELNSVALGCFPVIIVQT